MQSRNEARFLSWLDPKTQPGMVFQMPHVEYTWDSRRYQFLGATPTPTEAVLSRGGEGNVTLKEWQFGKCAKKSPVEAMTEGKLYGRSELFVS